MRAKAILLFVAAVTFALGPFMVPGFGGLDPNLYPNPQVDPPVQPAGYAFAIWGPIYLWLIASTGFGLLRRHDVADWDRMRMPLLISLVIGTAWLPIAMISAIWATILIFAMLITAALAMHRAPERDRWWAVAPVAFYTGWLTAASFASLGLTGAGFGLLLDEVGWAILAILLALGTALFIHAGRRDEWVYFTSVIWALLAIVIKNFGDVWIVAGVALAGAVFLTAIMVRRITLNLQRPRARA
ncbi:hypothetical protein [Maritimibacter dapengensis]|uniref:TspO and MBR related proteins n=1 Tax=Maritimibacter dapengensis TaxID=2836868 RepID=A0ABS6T2Z8_9RHOB|nr:hypothetical protein [Maritimibacter dapengensis]MBV7379630.1 hypothetical protein [Maritimibacter dapengensis]